MKNLEQLDAALKALPDDVLMVNYDTRTGMWSANYAVVMQLRGEPKGYCGATMQEAYLKAHAAKAAANVARNGPAREYESWLSAASVTASPVA